MLSRILSREGRRLLDIHRRTSKHPQPLYTVHPMERANLTINYTLGKAWRCEMVMARKQFGTVHIASVMALEGSYRW
jgi:hypothetical protein